jgi:hypothetical protein
MVVITGCLYRAGSFPGNFLLEVESIAVPMCGRKDYVIKKFQWHCLEPNPQPSGLVCRASTNCSTAFKCRRSGIVLQSTNLHIFSIFNLYFTNSSIAGQFLRRYDTSKPFVFMAIHVLITQLQSIKSYIGAKNPKGKVLLH